MGMPSQETYEGKNITVKVERIFTGKRTFQELVVELLKKRAAKYEKERESDENERGPYHGV